MSPPHSIPVSVARPPAIFPEALRRGALGALLVAGWAAISSARADGAPATLSLDDLAPGSAATARTVLQGTEIGDFDVEIVSVLRNVGPDRDMILAKAVGERIERLGVAQGMSGSPVYVEGKLIGAVSSTWPFAKDPMFGITPVGQMAREAEWGFRFGGAEAGVAKPGTGRDLLEDDPPPAPAEPGFHPIRSPLVLSGFDRRLVALAGELFEPWGFTVAEGGKAGGNQPGGPIRPGATIGVRLVGGDVDMTAFGTVTWIDDDRVHAWGHPFFQMGDVEMPLVSGYIHATVPSRMISFKLASGGEIVGTCTSDRRSGIFGRLGVKPRLTRFDLEVSRFGQKETHHFEIVRNRFLAPSLLGFVAANSILTRAGGVSDETVRFTQRIHLDDGRDTSVETLITGDRTLRQVVQLLSEATRAVALNPFEKIGIDAVEAELVYEPGIRAGFLTELIVDDDTPRPGETLRGAYTIRDYRGGEHRHRFAIPIPENAREGRYLLLAADAETAERYEAERDPRAFRPRDLDEYLDRLRRLRQTDEVHLHLYRQSRGALIDGTPLADLPPSVLSVMRGAARSGVEGDLPAELVHEARLPAGRFVRGSHTLLLEVRKEKP